MNNHFDVIVVGAGGSGLAAACSAAQHGGRVLVLEKRPQPGGTTGIAVGSFTAAGTRLQARADIQDDPQAHDEDAGKFAEAEIEARNNGPLRRRFLDEAAETLAWLEQLGLSFYGPSPEPPNRVPRMHNVVPGAKAYIAALQLALGRFDAALVCGAEVEQLLRSGERVTGVSAVVDGQRRRFHADRGVVLAAGDYAANAQLIAQHKGASFGAVEGINPHATGDGHRLAADAGAQLVNMDVCYGPELRFGPSGTRPFQQWLPTGGRAAKVMAAVARRLPGWVMRAMIKRLLVTWQHPETSLLEDGAILVNRRGERFVDEKAWPEREIATTAQPEKEAFLLLDGRLVGRYSAWPHFISTAPDIAYAYVADYQRLRSDVTTTGQSLEQVAARRGMDAHTLQETVDQFNAYVAAVHPDPMGRRGDEHPLLVPPWVLLGPLKAYFTTTEGGAAINQQMQVLDERGEVIGGLYAVGQNGLGGMILWGHGLHIAWAMTSGRLAGRYIMRHPED